MSAHRLDTPDADPSLVGWVATAAAAVALVIVAALCIWFLNDDSGTEAADLDAAPASTSTSASPSAEPLPLLPTYEPLPPPAGDVQFGETVPAEPLDDPEQVALGIKPLEFLAAGDRVIYKAEVCTWDEWSGDIAVSVVTCPSRGTFSVETGYLTPVEPLPDL